MKKIVLGLALCLGLSQVVVAAEGTRGVKEDAKGAVAWIKAHPVKVALITAGLMAVAAGAWTGVEILRFNASSAAAGNTWGAKFDGGVAKVTGSKIATPFVYLGGKAAGAVKGTGSFLVKHKTGSFVACGAVVAIILAGVIADYATTDKEAEMRLKKIFHSIFGKSAKKETATSEVVAEEVVEVVA